MLLITGGCDKTSALVALLFSGRTAWQLFPQTVSEQGQIKALLTPSANHEWQAPCCFPCWRSPKLPIKKSHSPSDLSTYPMLGFLLETGAEFCGPATLLGMFNHIFIPAGMLSQPSSSMTFTCVLTKCD